MQNTNHGARPSLLASAVAAVFAAGLGTAAAQERTSSDADADVEELVVTGTRIRRDEFATPNSMQSITREDMRDLGLIGADDLLLEMTANMATNSLDTNGDSSFFVGATLANLRGLNTGFGTRTLTLVNGRRMPATTNGGAVDLSMVPGVLVDRMETVTGGAGATYGSDAVAGVVNIVLDNRLDGTRVDASFGQTQEGDGDNYSFSFANGSYLLDRRAHLIVGYEHQTTDPIDSCHTARDWCARSWNYIDNAAGNGFGPSPGDPRLWDELPEIPNPAFPGMSWPRYVVLDDVRYIHSSPYGSLHTDNQNPADPFNGEFLEFTADGLEIVPYNTVADGLTGPMREYAYGGAQRRVQGGEGKLLSHGYSLRSGRIRNNLYARFDYDLNERLSFNVEVAWNRTDGESLQNRPSRHRQELCIHPDNAFIQPELGMSEQARQAIADRMTSCSFSTAITRARPGTVLYKDFSEQVDQRTKTSTEMTRIVIGAEGGMFGGDNWTWEAHFQYGETDRYQALLNYQTNHRFFMAVDSVIDEETGQPVCRINSSQGQIWRDVWKNYYQGRIDFSGTAPTTEQAQAKVDALRAGCVPLNPFGLAASPEALAYAYDDLIEFTDTTQRVLSGTVSGSFWKGFGAGPAMLATGIDYREDTIDNQAGGHPDPIVRQDFASQYGDPWAGGTEVADIFAEVEIPLLRNKPAARYMMVNLSNRRSRNSTFRIYESDGERRQVDRYSDSYKFSWVWNPTEWLRMRATRSADIRQPSARELFFRQTVRGGGYTNSVPNPWRTVDEYADTWDTVRGSNPYLRNEESITETVGFVFEPGGWADGLQLAVDYFQVNIKGGISYTAGTIDDEENPEGLPYTLWQCYYQNDPYYCSLIEFGPPTPEEPDNPRSDIISVATTYENSEPYWSSGVDFSARYSKRLAGGGSYSIRLMATRNIEQSICTQVARLGPNQTECLSRSNVVGQTGGLRAGGDVLSNYTAVPEWSGNLFGTYRKGPWSVTAQARYTGSAQGSMFWVGPDDPKYAPERWFTISKNRMPSWITWNTTVNYDFGRSRAMPSGLDTLRLSLRIENLFDKQPNFWSGGHIAGVNTRYFNGMGRTFRLQLQTEF